MCSTSGKRRARGEGGFTLLEVLVAFAITAPVLALLFSQGVGAVSSARTAARYQEAISRARSRLASLSDRSLVAGDDSGGDGGGFQWRTRIVPIASAPPSRAVPRGSPYVAGVTLYEVSVEVSWPGAGSARALVLNTRRLGPTASSGP